MRLRLGLKWFLLACVAAAILVAYVGKPWFDQRRQQQFLEQQQLASAELAGQGAAVTMEEGRIIKVLVHRPVSNQQALRALKHAIDIEQLQIYSGADDDLVELFAGHHELRELTLGGSGITNRSLRTIGKLHRLQTLAIGGTAIDDDGLAKLRDLSDLRTLDLTGTKVLGTGLKHLSHLSSLETLNLALAPVDDAHLAAVGSLSGLTKLDLSETNVRGPGLAQLGKIPRLERLTLGKMTLTDGSGLSDLDHLYSLTMFYVTIPPAEMAHIAGMEGLMELTIHGPMFTDKHLEALAKAKQIRAVELWGPTVTEDGLAQLHTMDRLERITLFGGLSDDAAERVSERLPKVAIQLGTLRDGRVFGPKAGQR